MQSFSITWDATPNLPGPATAQPLSPQALGSEVFQARASCCLRAASIGYRLKAGIAEICKACSAGDATTASRHQGQRVPARGGGRLLGTISVVVHAGASPLSYRPLYLSCFSDGECNWVFVVQAVLEAGGCTSATVDEYFFQDLWRGPTSVVDKILLFLGDPLMTVEVPWEPTTLVQDWRL